MCLAKSRYKQCCSLEHDWDVYFGCSEDQRDMVLTYHMKIEGSIDLGSCRISVPLWKLCIVNYSKTVVSYTNHSSPLYRIHAGSNTLANESVSLTMLCARLVTCVHNHISLNRKIVICFLTLYLYSE